VVRESGLPKPARRTVENRDPCVGQRLQHVGEGGRRVGEAGAIILLLPLGKAKGDGKGGARHRPDRADHLAGEARATAPVAAPEVSPPVRLRPEKCIDQIAVRAVDLDAVEPQPQRQRRGPREGIDNVGDLPLGHRPRRLPRPGQRAARFRRSQAGHVGVRRQSRPPIATGVPELREDASTRRVHRLDDRGPAGRSVAVEPRHPGIGCGRGVRHIGALGDDQPDARRGPPAAIVRDHRVRTAVGAEIARHRRHHDPVRQGKRPDPDELEQPGEAGISGHGRTPRPRRAASSR
jgi:hypothetical protein